MLRVEFTNYSVKFLDKCETNVRNKLLDKIEILSKEPFPRGVIKLKSSGNNYRIRIGKFRVIYSVNGEVIIVHKIDKRARIYK